MKSRFAKFALVLAIMFTMLFSTANLWAVDEPDWTPIGNIVDNPANILTITEDISGYPSPSDSGPYAMGWAGNSKDNYCNTDRHFDFQNWVSVAQWMRIKVENIDRHIIIRKPGVYTITDKPMIVLIASNGDVLVTFVEVWGSGTWDAKWYEYPNKQYPKLADELEPQTPVDKKYMVTTTGTVDVPVPTGWQETPAGDGVIKFLNTTTLHNLSAPTDGFQMQFQETVVPCNTTGDYVLKGRIIFQAVNQMWYINPATGQINRARDSNMTPPQSYIYNPMSLDINFKRLLQAA